MIPFSIRHWYALWQLSFKFVFFKQQKDCKKNVGGVTGEVLGPDLVASLKKNLKMAMAFKMYRL